LSLTLIFRVFAAILGLFGILNFVLLLLADPIARFSPFPVTPTTGLTDAILLFGVGAAVWMLGHRQKAHH
jgi:hypothetical protein